MNTTLPNCPRVARLLPDGKPRYIRIYDADSENTGRVIDRYTVVFTGRYTQKTGGEHWILGMNAAPFHPQGFGQHSVSHHIIDRAENKWPPVVGRKCHLGKRIEWDDLPSDCQKLVMSDYCNLWDLPDPTKTV